MADMNLKNQKYKKFLTTAVMELDRTADNYELIKNLMIYGFHNWLPGYFFTVPASSTGKYHPAFANRNDGLALHTIAVIRETKLLCKTFYVDQHKDMVNMLLAAAFFHDMFKYGPEKDYKPEMYTDHAHPIIASEFLLFHAVAEWPNILGMINSERRFDMVDLETTIFLISRCVATHMGEYTTSKYSQVVLPEPVTTMERILHTADYLASRKEHDFVADLL